MADDRYHVYALTNNSANIRRIRQRIEHLEAQAAAPEREPVTGDGYRISEDAADNRVLIEFDSIPDEEMRSRLKRGGFRWSPTRGAWVRQRSNAAWEAARYALRQTEERA